MLYCLLQSSTAHPHLAHGLAPRGLLNDAERAEFTALRTAKRRGDWLLGRWTAKHLLQAVIEQETGERVPLAALAIGKQANGVPFATYDDTLGNVIGLALSISHCNGRAFCAAGSPLNSSPSVGADIEHVEARSSGFLNDYFTAPEIDQVLRAAAPLRDRMLTAMWSAKEAVLKALQLGLTVDTRRVSCLMEWDGTRPEMWLPFEIGYDADRLTRFTPALTGWWRTWEDYVLTLVIEGSGHGSPCEMKLVTQVGGPGYDQSPD